MNSIGNIISTARKAKHYSQPKLAEELKKIGIDVSFKTISNWERNLAEPSVSIYYKVCQILGITNMYEAYFDINPDNPLSYLNEEGVLKALDYIDLLKASGKYEKQQTNIIQFPTYIDIYENAVSAGTGNFLEDVPKKTIQIDASALPQFTSFGVRISGDSMEPEFMNNEIAWVAKQNTVASGEIGIFSLNGEAYIKKLSDTEEGVYLISLNDKYAPIPIGENDRLDVLGKVVGKTTSTIC